MKNAKTCKLITINLSILQALVSPLRYYILNFWLFKNKTKYKGQKIFNKKVNKATTLPGLLKLLEKICTIKKNYIPN